MEQRIMELKKLETMPVEEKERYYNQQLQHVIQYAYQNAPPVKEKLDSAGIAPAQIRTIKDLEMIPVTKKEEIVELQKKYPPFGGYVTKPMEELQWVHISPGPIYTPIINLEAIIEGAASALGDIGFGKGDIVINTTGYHLVVAGLGLDLALRIMGATVIPSGPGNTELQIEIMRHMKVTGFGGFVRFLLTIMEKAEELGYDFRRDFALRHAVVLGEIGVDFPSIRKRIEEKYGVNLMQLYGTADLGLVALECGQKSGMHLVEGLVAEFVDPLTGKRAQPGEPGELVATILHETYPLIRLATGDLVRWTDEPCPCGRTSPRLMEILGRVGEVTKVKGMFLWIREVEQVVAKFPQISKSQVVLSHDSRGRDVLTLRLELVEESIGTEKLSQDFGAAFQGICRLRLDKVEFVTKGAFPEGYQKLVDERGIRKWE